MCLISMNEEKTRHFFGVLFVFLPYLGQEILPFSDMAADHWCLSLIQQFMLISCQTCYGQC